jgi:hypothetical protein
VIPEENVVGFLRHDVAKYNVKIGSCRRHGVGECGQDSDAKILGAYHSIRRAIPDAVHYDSRAICILCI